MTFQAMFDPMELLRQQAPWMRALEAIRGRGQVEPTPTLSGQPIGPQRGAQAPLSAPPAFDLGGLLAPEDRSAAKRRGLLAAGLSMMENSRDPNGGVEPPNIFQVLSRGINAGVGAYQQTLGQQQQMALLAQKLMADREAQARQQALREKMGRAFEGVTDPVERFRRAQELLPMAIEAGDEKAIGALSQLVQAMKVETPKPPKREWLDVGGEKVLVGEDGMPVLDAEGKPTTMRKTPTPRDPNVGGGGGTGGGQEFNREDKLTDDYNRDTRDTRTTAEKVAGALAEAPNARRGDGVAQVNMLYAFVSSMDPGTAVREGEIGLVRSAASLRQQAAAYLDKYGRGEAVVVPPAMVAQMEALLRRRYEGLQRYVKERGNYYESRAKRYGLSGRDLFPGLPDAPAAPAADVSGLKQKYGGLR